jgi:hypothetical protein
MVGEERRRLVCKHRDADLVLQLFDSAERIEVGDVVARHKCATQSGAVE